MEVALVVFAAKGLEGAFAVGGFVHGRAGEADERGVGQASHQEVAEVTARRAVRLIDQHENIFPCVQVGRHVAELVDHRHDDAPVVLPLAVEQAVEFRDAVRVCDVPEAD